MIPRRCVRAWYRAASLAIASSEPGYRVAREQVRDLAPSGCKVSVRYRRYGRVWGARAAPCRSRDSRSARRRAVVTSATTSWWADHPRRRSSKLGSLSARGRCLDKEPRGPSDFQRKDALFQRPGGPELERAPTQHEHRAHPVLPRRRRARVLVRCSSSTTTSWGAGGAMAAVSSLAPKWGARLRVTTRHYEKDKST